MQKQHTSLRRGETLPDILLIKRPWKTDSLKNISQMQLEDWLNHMETGVKPELNDYTVQYELGGHHYEAHIRTNHLLLPDGTSLPLGGEADKPVHTIDNSIEEQVIRHLQSQLAYPNVHRPDVKTTPYELVRELVTNSFELINKHGLEKHGCFVELGDRLIHRPAPQTPEIMVNLDVRNKKTSGIRYPLIILGVETEEKEAKRAALTYHTHPHPHSRKPNQLDINAMTQTGDTSIIIANRIKGKEPAYVITEWKLKSGVEIQEEIRRRSTPENTKIIDWLSYTEMLKLIHQCFDVKQYLLKKQDDRITLTEKPTARQKNA